MTQHPCAPVGARSIPPHPEIRMIPAGRPDGVCRGLHIQARP